MRSNEEVEALRAEAREVAEAEARGLRLEVEKLSTSRDALEGLAVMGDGWAQARLGEINAAIEDRMGRLSELALDKSGR